MIVLAAAQWAARMESQNEASKRIGKRSRALTDWLFRTPNLERIAPSLDALEADFRPLVRALPPRDRAGCYFPRCPDSRAGGCRVTLLEAAAALRRREISSAELTAAALERIERLNPATNAMQTVMADAARERARQADEELARGEGRGPLHGIPIAVKDLFFTKGVRTTGGSKLFEDHVPDHDAAVVERLRAAGAVLVGKTGMHELAYGITSSNPHFGAVRNPWDRDRIPGGSSGGSGAAVAGGMVFMAMGSDTGGSIRIPASFCGSRWDLKPTYGRVSRYGAMPLGFSLDHMGPLTRSVRDAGAVLNVIAGYDPRDESSSRRPVENYVPETGAFARRPAHRHARELLFRAPGSRSGCGRARALSRTAADRAARRSSPCACRISPPSIPWRASSCWRRLPP